MSEHESPNKLSSQTTPTWEVELLISGVAVFAMLQLPGWLDDAVFALTPRLDASWAMLAELLYYYAKSATVILAASFVIHLLLRARWIALVGMHSVYPGGVRWDKLRMGPIQREVEAGYQDSTEVVIERADNLATTVFAIGVMLAIVLAVLTLGMAVAMGSAIWLASLVHWDNGAFGIFFFVFALVMVPFALAVTLDRRFGKRWQRGSRVHGLLSGLFRLFARIGMRPGNNHTRALLVSNGNDRRVSALIVLIIGCTVGLVMFGYWSMRKGTQFGSYDLFPADVSPGARAAHYDDSRDPARDPAVPFVQSMVVAGPYLRLLIPYEPRRDAAALQRDCTIGALRGAPRDQALLACLQRLHPVSLDGVPVPDLHYIPASDPRTDRPALLAMIEIRALATGRHLLQVGRSPDPTMVPTEREQTADTADQGFVIPFWR